ncbi:MAG TPA: flagellar biosynthetic protein FliP, partial [Paracoccaceae bacterium]|nr:flagellar biosynthetic protein FliP [Paracoccaceae bacterium]
MAQTVTFDLGEGPGLSGRAVQLILLLTLLSLVPGLAVMITCFPFVVTVLSILRQAIGLQQSPPNMLIVTLALFLTWYVMDPVLAEAWRVAGEPLTRDAIGLEEAIPAALGPFRVFMAA